MAVTATPVVTAANGLGMPVVVVTANGMPVTEASNGRGIPVVIATNGYGTPVVFVTPT